MADNENARVKELDLRPIPHGRRHGLVFETFDKLAVGESFIIVNDHDPSPLRMQMEFMRHGELSWVYLEQGPEDFRVEIKRAALPASERPKASGSDPSVFTRF
ncbi:MAG: DUF2249 domain-containing protein [Bryobacterales bacterium]|nr:DUF2249 domain-containing protein [Bryobacterales bacterium]MEB2361296.1 DUF2249 domain-containing protein [Bryobacterales bacterium]